MVIYHKNEIHRVSLFPLKKFRTAAPDLTVLWCTKSPKGHKESLLVSISIALKNQQSQERR